jgi:hypothetical protein
MDLDIDNTDRAVVLLQLSVDSSVGTTALPLAAGPTAVVALDATLGVRWVLQFPSRFTPSALRVDGLGNVSVGGTCTGAGAMPVTGGSAPTVSCGSASVFFLGFTPDGRARSITPPVVYPAPATTGVVVDIALAPGATRFTRMSVATNFGMFDVEVTGSPSGRRTLASTAAPTQITVTSSGTLVSGALSGTASLDTVTLTYGIDEFTQPFIVQPLLGATGLPIMSGRTWVTKSEITSLESAEGDLVWIAGIGIDTNRTDFGGGLTSSSAYLARVDPATQEVVQIVPSTTAPRVWIRALGDRVAAAWLVPGDAGGGAFSSSTVSAATLHRPADGAYVLGWPTTLGLNLNFAASASASLVAVGDLYDATTVGGTTYAPVSGTDTLIAAVPVAAF